jgi:hypothetical protein
MDTQELRIGNWVKIKQSHFDEFRDSIYELYQTNEFKITGWNDGSGADGCKQIAFYSIAEKFFAGRINGGVYDQDIEPIFLTKEWLLRFGFEEHSLGYYNKDLEFFISYANTGLHEYRFRDFPCTIKYVHQLQNLYFSLMHKELEFYTS